MLFRLKLKNRLICGFSLIALIGGAIGVAGIGMVTRLSNRLQETENYYAFSSLSDNALESILEHRRREKDVFLNVDNPFKKHKSISLFNKETVRLRKTLWRIHILAAQIPQLTPEGRRLIAAFPAKHDAYVAGFADVLAAMDANPRMSPMDADKRMQEHKHLAYELEDQLREVEGFSDKLADEMVRRGVRDSTKVKVGLGGMVLLGFCAALGLGTLIAGRIIDPLRQLTIAACKLRKGECNVNIPFHSKDQLGALAESFRQMLSAQQRKVVMAEEIAAGNLKMLRWSLPPTATLSGKRC